MKRILFLLIFCLMIVSISAQRVSRSYQAKPMPNVLIDLDQASKQYKISFIYNELEDFKVTKDFRNLSVPEAIRSVIGFYPLGFTVTDSLITVECVQKDNMRLIGHLVDKNNQPVSFANIQLLDADSLNFITGGVTNENGDFVIPCNSSKVVARFSCVGYKTLDMMTTVKKIGTVHIQDETLNLKGIVVKGHTPQYKLGSEGMITTVEHTTLSQLGSADDVLQHIPMVTKKGDGSLYVFGKGTPIVYINGRQMRQGDMLTRLKSSDIKSVEVINNPGARYDATVSAVIKIKTKISVDEGWSVDAKSTVSQGYNTSLDEQVNWDYRHNRLDLFGNFRYVRQSAQTESNITSLVEADTTWYETLRTTQDETLSKAKIGIGLDYSINDNHSIGAKYDFSYGFISCDNPNISTSDVLANGKSYDHLQNQFMYHRGKNPEHDINIYYNGKIGNTTIDFNGDFMSEQESRSIDYNEKSSNFDDRQFSTYSPVSNRLWAANFEIGHPLLGGKLTAGAEYTNTYRQDDYYNDSEIISSSCNTLEQNKIAPYMEYKRMTPIGIVNAGLRYEYAKFNYYENGSFVAEQSREYSNLFPSLSLGTQLGKVKMQLSYTAKTQRPTYSELRSNVAYVNRFSYETGNPHLKDEMIQDVTLAGMWKFLQFGLSFKHHKNSIFYWGEQAEKNPAITIITRKNHPSFNDLMFYLAVAPKIGIWNPQFNIAIQKQWLNLQTQIGEYKMSTPVAMISLDNGFHISDSFTANAQLRLQTHGNVKNIMLTRNMWVMNITMTKTFLNDRLSISLQGKDLFHQTKDVNAMLFDRSNLTILNSYDSRNVVFSVAYKFNVRKSNYKGTGAGNDEKKRL